MPVAVCGRTVRIGVLRMQGEMRGLTTNIVNLIADNLRDRYDNGFPILKELIQNADDAKARRLIFGRHPGFPDSRQPLLHGSGLWFFNDGEFTESDADDLCSFGIGSKAGDPDAIGKFGLGMKSVFHLCEALFYMAWDGAHLHYGGLNPWKLDGLHQDWDETSDDDWRCLKDIGRKFATGGEDCTWFLLWLPLRMKEHLRTPQGEKTGAIIRRFPGDEPTDLAFLSDGKLAHDLAEMLPLLRHLEHVEHQGEVNRFALWLTSDAPRLMGHRPCQRDSGQVLWADERRLVFSGRRIESHDTDGRFTGLKDREEWPRTRYRDRLGQPCEKKDKASPEGAVLFCSGRRRELGSRLHWAVFLPLEDGSEELGGNHKERGHSLTLHGQFFLDAGRKRIHDFEHLDQESELPSVGAVDESLLRSAWNRRLAQEVVLPLVLPTLGDHVRQHGLPEGECRDLTEAIGNSGWFKKFRKHICRDHVWLRTLEQGARSKWSLADRGSRSRLRPFPNPPGSAPDRPWTVFPKLSASGVLLYDVEAPCLDVSDRPGKWSEMELESLLSRLDGLFVDAPSMDYMIDFFHICAGTHLSNERVQSRFLGVLRHGLGAAGPEARRRVAAKSSRLVGFLQPERRLALAADLPESILKGLWGIDAPVLLIPKDFEPESAGKASPDETALAAWLQVLDRALDSPDLEEASQPILQTVQGLLQAIATEGRARFLKQHRTLRIIKAWDARSGVEKPLSVERLDQVREVGCLFTFAEGLREARMGIAPLLARAMPDADVYLVRAPTYRELFSEDEVVGNGSLPAASDGRACLAAFGRYTGQLGGVSDRRSLLERVSDPITDSDARRGLRFLLHGSPDHRDEEDAKLWIGRHDQHHAWTRLWSVMHDDAQWSRIDEELANAIPRNRWADAKIAEIDAGTLIDELRGTGRGINEPKVFSVDERDEILSRIDDESLWRRLPLHTTLDGTPISADHEGVYLAPGTRGQEDPLAGEVTLIALSQNDRVADRQQRWLPPFDDRARIEVALSVAGPVRYWRNALDALDRLPTPIGEKIQRLLRSKAWLPTIYGTQVNPEDVIDLPESLADETHQLIAKHRASNGPCFAVPDDLKAPVRDHRAWPRLRCVGFSSGVDGLERLGLLLEDLPDYRIGKWTKHPQPETVELLAHCEDLPGWRLLAMATAEPFDSETAWSHLEPVLSREIEVQSLVTVLDWLSQDNQQWELRKSAHDNYLRQLMAHGRQSAGAHLPHLRLASGNRQWREAAELCVGAPGVVQASLLDGDQADTLGNVVWGGTERQSRASSAPAAGFQQARKAAREILQDYFDAWDSSLVPQPMIGVLLALLGQDLRDLASEYLHPHSFGWLAGELPWNDPGGTRERLNWMGGKTVEQALDLISTTGVQIVDGDQVDVHNLLGDPIRVAIDASPGTLLAGPLGGQGYELMIRLRRIEPDRFQQEAVPNILRATVEQVYSVLYNQKNADFDSLWQELAQSDQLEVGIARQLILDHIPFYLSRQLSVNSRSIKEQLRRYDVLRSRIVEVERQGGQSTKSVRNDSRQALDQLASCIDESPDERREILQAVKSRLEQYQYDPSSIPLELFQNADDAAVELGQCLAYSSEGTEVPESARRFVVVGQADGLRFLHWGRRINARGPVGFDGERRGFHQDLEKMLILSATDKPGDEDATGKFGLGFKSVLLACDEPSILSGRLAVRVVAGILPQPWEDNADARRQLVALSLDSRQPGTLIDLPGVGRELQARVLGRFQKLAGILCVFGRAIRSITQVGETELSYSWVPTEVCPRVEVGELHLQGEWGSRTKTICIRTDDGSLLMALRPQGFRALPDSVPALWVTAPTREATSVGFAINGSFDLDAGRGRLAGDTHKNLSRARRIGQQAGEALGVLLERSHDDWDSVRTALSLAADLDALGFWESVWVGLTKGWLRHVQDHGMSLARETALGALSRLCKCRYAIPNGLTGQLRGFVDAVGIRYELNSVLLREDVGEELAAWGRFTSRYRASACVSGKIGGVLREAKLCHPQPLGLPALVGLLERTRVDPGDAEVLGRLWLLTEEEEDWESDDLRRRLNGLLFLSQAGEWTTVRKLLTVHGSLDSDDEPRRHDLAPSECRLHTSYYAEGKDDWPAVAFFLACRQRMEASAETLAQWVLDAESVEEQSAALRYLADGDLGEQVAERIREIGWLPSAISNFDLTCRLTDEQQDRLRRRLVSSKRIERAVTDAHELEPSAPGDDGASAAEFFGRLADWWADDRRRNEVLDQHEEDCWPSWLRESGLGDGLRSESRDHWLALFVLGACQSLGRTKDVQHRDFLQLAYNEKWWGVFRQPANHGAWMKVLCDWQDGAVDRLEYGRWLSLFPTIYQLSRHLDDYRSLMNSAAERPEHLYSVRRLLAPRADEALSGAGSRFDAPPLPLGIGFHWCLRELARLKVLVADHLFPDCYVPARRALNLLRPLGLVVEDNEDAAAKSQAICQFLQEDGRPDSVKAHLLHTFDIPLRYIAENGSLRRKWALDYGDQQTRSGGWVQSKSEVIIANVLSEQHVDYEYEKPLFAPDGTCKVPDFTIRCNGDEWYWEHCGMMNDATYRADRESKVKWYHKHFEGRLEETFESGDLIVDAMRIIRERCGASC